MKNKEKSKNITNNITNNNNNNNKKTIANDNKYSEKIINSGIDQFERRKLDHINLALKEANQIDPKKNLLNKITLKHTAFPEINYDEVIISTNCLNHKINAPFFIAALTAGHSESLKINQKLIKCAEERNWVIGVGSQRKEIFSQEAQNEWKKIRKEHSKVILLGNIGITQLFNINFDKIERMVDNIQASAMVVHTNPLQEALQPEGTPFFKGALNSLEKLCNVLSVPVIIKETGCGFSLDDFLRLKNIPLYAIDISGYGGSHFGRIEGDRCKSNSFNKKISMTFKNWGIDTVSSLFYAKEAQINCSLWASGGVRSGLNAACLIALGADMVGFAQPILKIIMHEKFTEDDLLNYMALCEQELKLSMFLSGCKNIKDLQERNVWQFNHQMR